MTGITSFFVGLIIGLVLGVAAGVHDRMEK